MLEHVADGEFTRRGFLRGQLFLHPELKLQYRFPDGWKIWDAGDEVIGLSAAQDAMIRLRVVAGTPREAAQAFFRELTPGAEPILQHRAINGLSATTSAFIIDAGDWMVRGYVAFIAYGGTTYLVTASSTGTEFERYTFELERSIASFNGLMKLGTPAAKSARPAAVAARGHLAVRVR